MGDELSSGQARDCYTHTHTHGHTDPQTQAMTIPEGQNWPRVKTHEINQWSQTIKSVCSISQGICIWFMFCCVLLWLANSKFYHLLQGYFTATGAMKWLPLKWHHYGRDGVSNHCLFNRLFRLRSKKTSKLRVTGLCVGNWPGPVKSPHKGPVTWKMFPFDDICGSMEVF